MISEGFDDAMTIAAASTVLGVCVAGTVLLIVSTLTMWRVRSHVALRWSHVVTRLLSVTLLGVMLLFIAPRVRTLLLEWDIHLPYVGVPVFKLSDLAYAFFPHLLLIGLVALAAEMTFFESCLWSNDDEQIEFARLCSFLVTSSFGLTLLVVHQLWIDESRHFVG